VNVRNFDNEQQLQWDAWLILVLKVLDHLLNEISELPTYYKLAGRLHLLRLELLNPTPHTEEYTDERPNLQGNDWSANHLVAL
jgi:hypothetical protein